LFYVDSLEDLVGGHLYIAVILIAGGIWHLLVEPFQWVKERFIFNGDGILAYSLFGVALGGFAASYFCGFNSLAHPVEFYGPTLELKPYVLPHYLNPTNGAATSRTLLANGFFYAAFLCFAGSIWEFARATGFDFAAVRQTWKQAAAEVSPFPVLSYQKEFHYEPQPDWGVWYEAARVEPKPAFQNGSQWSLQSDRPSVDDHVYGSSKVAKLPAITHGTATRNTLYEVTYHPKRSIFYHSPSVVRNGKNYGSRNGLRNGLENGAENKEGDRQPLTMQYESPKVNRSSAIHPKPKPATFYGNRSTEFKEPQQEHRRTRRQENRRREQEPHQAENAE
jgi:hypothetical protein